ALGAVYSPVGEMVPTVAVPPGTALTNQCTALLKVPVPCTVAVNCCVWPNPTFAVWGVTRTVLIVGGGSTVTWAEPLSVESASLTAEIVTGLALGTALGAVYSPVGEMVPTVALPPDTALTNQCTVLLTVP